MKELKSNLFSNKKRANSQLKNNLRNKFKRRIVKLSKQEYLRLSRIWHKIG